MDRLVWAALACTATALAQPAETAADLAARYLPELIRLDTTNPPGNETRVARYLKQVADREGIPAELLGDDPERLNFVARLRGTGKQRPLLLIAHSDVVPADRSQWSVDPLAAIEMNGYIYGRGAEDDKQLLAAELAVMVDLHRRRVVLDRDIILLSESDEGLTSTPYISSRCPWMSRVVMPRAYIDRILPSKPAMRVWPFGMIWGSNVPSRSRGVMTSISPNSPFKVFLLFPLRRLPLGFASWSCFSYPRWFAISASSARSISAFVNCRSTPFSPVRSSGFL